MNRWTVVGVGLASMTFLLPGCGDASTSNGAPQNGAQPKGPPACASSGKTAYETHSAKVPAILASIVAASGAETGKGAASGIGGSFGKIGTPGFDTFDQAKQNIGDFLVRGWGGPDNYKGKTLAASHAPLAVTSDQYDFFVNQIYIPALQQNGIPQSDLACFLAPVSGNPGSVGAQAKADIVTR